MKEIYVIPRLNEIDRFNELEKREHVHFEFNEFYIPSLLDDKAKLEEVIQKYEGRSGDTLHGVFLDMALDSSDSMIRNAAYNRFRGSLEIATRLKCKGVIFHTNYYNFIKTNSYRDNWVKCNAEAYREFLREFPDVDIYVENMFDEHSDLILRLAEELKDEPRFGICLDIAHAYLSKESISSWISNLKPYIKHIHINDNLGYMDSHFPIGEGSIPYADVFKELKDVDASILLEVKDYDATIKSLKKIKEWM